MSLPSNKNGQPTVRVAIYVRKSSRKNLALEFNSLDAQRASCVRFVTERANQGWQLIDEEFADGGISGKSTANRPGWLRLVQRVEQGLVDIILVYRTDRAFRSLRDFLVSVDHFNQLGVQLVSISEPFTMDTAFGRAIGNILAVINQLERELTGERIRDNIAERQREGKHVGGQPPFGYYMDRSNPNNKVPRPHPEHAPVIKFIFKRFIECGSPVTILKELHERNWQFVCITGADSEHVSSRPFEISDIGRLVKNRMYAGWIYNRQTKEVFDGQHEPIVSRELFEAVQQKIARGRRSQADCTRTSVAGVLKGLCFCGHCETRMRMTYSKNHGKKYRYYICANVTRRHETKCSRRYYPAGQLEQAAFEYLRKVFRAPEICSSVLRSVHEQRAECIAELRARKSNLKAQVLEADQALTKQLADGNAEFGREAELSERDLRAVKKQLADVEAKLADATRTQLSDADILESLQNMDRVWELLEPYKQARIVRLLLKRVTVYDDKLKFELHVNGVRSLIDDIAVINSDGQGEAAADAVTTR